MSATHRLEYIELVARLRQARKAKGLTQPQMAALLKKPQSYVSKIETCERRIDPVETALWCRAVGMEIEDILPPSLKTVLLTSGDRDEADLAETAILEEESH